ncbi:protein of unknown function [Rhodovastum atsumiense]|nr:protein of unknown function [Rhodovastum atsumiense]
MSQEGLSWDYCVLLYRFRVYWLSGCNVPDACHVLRPSVRS